MRAASHGITQLLLAWQGGDQQALDLLVRVVYEELRRPAHRSMRRERPGHALQTTALVNEVCLNLVGLRQISLDESALFAPAPDPDLPDLDEALTAPSSFDARKARVVELRFFVGLTLDETAEVLTVSADTVGRDWDSAKTWLRRRMARSRTGAPPGRKSR